jgi:hypothetical protein
MLQGRVTSRIETASRRPEGVLDVASRTLENAPYMEAKGRSGVSR